MQKLIDKYNLIEHPEGGYYREVYRSKQILKPYDSKEKKSAITHIYFLLLKGQISRFHKIIQDEIWTYYKGSPLKIIKYDTFEVKEEIIGYNSGNFFSIIKGGTFQSAECLGDYSLVGCTVSPGFEFKDFSFLSDYPSLKEKLLTDHSDYKKFL
jgi:uncharacterized protein